MSRHASRTPNKVDNGLSRQPSAPLDTPLLVRLHTDYCKLPAGFTYELPRYAAELLLRQKVAHMVGTVGAQPDLTLDESDWEQASAPDRASETRCIHVHADPSSPRCLIEGAASCCPVCAVDRICSLLNTTEGKAGEVARALNFRSCKHGYPDKRVCLICYNGTVGALQMMWAHVRARTFDSTPEANRLLRLLQILAERYRQPIGAQPMRTEKAILHSERWEKRA